MTRLWQRPDLLAALATALAGVVWGLFWLPLRALEAAGLSGMWSSATLYAVSILLLAPLALWRWRRFRHGGWDLVVTGLFTGGAFALYAASLIMTDVVRALLLFYITPVWGTLFGCLLLGERLTRARSLALLLGLSGLVVILGFEHGFPMPSRAGDWMALLAGIVWAYGSLRLFRTAGKGAFEPVYTSFLAGLATSLVLLTLPIEGRGGLPDPDAALRILPWLFAASALFFVPGSLLAFWGACRLSPGLVGILFMGEVVVGVGSAAVLTDEPFGLREVLGATLVIAAGAVEVLYQATRGGQSPPLQEETPERG